MRIIGGTCRGTALASPKSNDVRPTPDKVRGAIFNIIGSDIEGADFLDLFAGTGAVGLEALSRGAGHVAAVEKTHAPLVSKNLDRLKNIDPARFSIIKSDFIAVVEKFAKSGRQFDYVFADPPWSAGLETTILDVAPKVLKPGGTLITESFGKTVFPDNPSRLIIYKERRYGDTIIRFYERT